MDIDRIEEMIEQAYLDAIDFHKMSDQEQMKHLVKARQISSYACLVTVTKK
jgi:hypothetical protein